MEREGREDRREERAEKAASMSRVAMDFDTLRLIVSNVPTPSISRALPSRDFTLESSSLNFTVASSTGSMHSTWFETSLTASFTLVREEDTRDSEEGRVWR